MKYDVMTNNKRSLFLINCRLEGDRLLFDVGVFFPGLSEQQEVRSIPDRAVKIALASDQTAIEKTTVFFNGSLKITNK